MKLEVLGPVKGLMVEQQRKLVQLGTDVITTTIEVGNKYLALAKYIRTEKLPPKQVREVLSHLGFHKVRISEINAVANVPDDMWKEIEARTLSFRKALDVSRGVVRELLGEGEPEDTSGHEAKDKELEDTSGQHPAEAAVTPDEKKKLGAARAGKYLLNAAEYFNWKEKKFANGSGWVVIVRRETKTPKKGKTNDKA